MTRSSTNPPRPLPHTIYPILSSYQRATESGVPNRVAEVLVAEFGDHLAADEISAITSLSLREVEQARSTLDVRDNLPAGIEQLFKAVGAAAVPAGWRPLAKLTGAVPLVANHERLRRLGSLTAEEREQCARIAGVTPETFELVLASIDVTSGMDYRRGVPGRMVTELPVSEAMSKLPRPLATLMAVVFPGGDRAESMQRLFGQVVDTNGSTVGDIVARLSGGQPLPGTRRVANVLRSLDPTTLLKALGSAETTARAEIEHHLSGSFQALVQGGDPRSLASQFDPRDPRFSDTVVTLRERHADFQRRGVEAGRATLDVAGVSAQDLHGASLPVSVGR